MPTVQTKEGAFAYEAKDVPYFCGGLRFCDLRRAKPAAAPLAWSALLRGETLLSSVLDCLAAEGVASGFISDAVGGLWDTYLFRDVFTAEQLDTGCTITKDGNTYVLSPPYMNANSGNMVQSLIIIIPLQYTSEEDEEDYQ